VCRSCPRSPRSGGAGEMGACEAGARGAPRGLVSRRSLRPVPSCGSSASSPRATVPEASSPRGRSSRVGALRRTRGAHRRLAARQRPLPQPGQRPLGLLELGGVELERGRDLREPGAAARVAVERRHDQLHEVIRQIGAQLRERARARADPLQRLLQHSPAPQDAPPAPGERPTQDVRTSQYGITWKLFERSFMRAIRAAGAVWIAVVLGPFLGDALSEHHPWRWPGHWTPG
jgi:hypothetical protein